MTLFFIGACNFGFSNNTNDCFLCVSYFTRSQKCYWLVGCQGTIMKPSDSCAMTRPIHITIDIRKCCHRMLKIDIWITFFYSFNNWLEEFFILFRWHKRREMIHLHPQSNQPDKFSSHSGCTSESGGQTRTLSSGRVDDQQLSQCQPA